MNIITVDFFFNFFIFFNFFLDWFFFELNEFFYLVTYTSFWGDMFNFDPFVLSNFSLFFSIKFLIIIFFLILIRGGIPRYRYDYLTKLGWLKFLSLILASFLIVLFLFLIN